MPNICVYFVLLALRLGFVLPCFFRKDDLDEQARVKERLIQTQLARDSAIEAQDAAARLKSIQAEHQTLGL